LTESENGEGKIKTSGGPNVKAETPLKCRLATCSYKAFEPSMGNAVRITRFLPHCELPYELAGSAMVLAPTWTEWGLAKNDGSGERFAGAYRARMDTLGVNTIEPVLVSLRLSGTLVLLCFESLAGVPPDEQQFVCYRRALASWWQQMTGDEVPELSDQLQP
jgi:hypothetical protein